MVGLVGSLMSAVLDSLMVGLFGRSGGRPAKQPDGRPAKQPDGMPVGQFVLFTESRLENSPYNKTICKFH